MLAIAPVGGFDADFIEMFSTFEYRYTGGEYDDEVFHYRLFVPTAEDAEQKFPLVVWLHGRGEAGRDNIDHLAWLEHLVFKPPWQRDRFKFYLLAVQCPLDNNLWLRRNSGRGDDMINVVKAILDQTLAKYPIDADRVSLAGVSSGGTGVWDLAARHPDYFSAIAPMASSGLGDKALERLQRLPVWAFHCTRDPGTPIDSVRHTVDELQRIGCTAQLTEVDAATHDCWTPAFADYHLLDWLLEQQRGKTSPSPGTVSWHNRFNDLLNGWLWWQALLQLTIPSGFIFLGWWFIRKGRQNRSVSNSQASP